MEVNMFELTKKQTEVYVGVLNDVYHLNLAVSIDEDDENGNTISVYETDAIDCYIIAKADNLHDIASGLFFYLWDNRLSNILY